MRGALVAEGRTEIHRIYHLDRGYWRMEEKLARLGAQISREHDNDPRRLVENYIEYQRRFSNRLRWAPGTGQEPVEEAEQGAAAGGASHRN